MSRYMHLSMQARIWDAWAQGLSISRISRSLPRGDLNVRNLIYAKGVSAPNRGGAHSER